MSFSPGSLGQHRPGDESRPPARSRYPRRRWARRNASCACATPAPPAAHQRVDRAPWPSDGHGLRPARHSPRSRPVPPSSGRRAAIRRPRPPQPGPPALQAQQPGGRRTTVLTHLGPPILQTSDIRKLCEVPGAVLAALHRRQQHTAPRFMTKSLFTKATKQLQEVSRACFKKSPELAGHVGFGCEPKVVLIDDRRPHCQRRSQVRR
jgi:hypothetical protein